MNKREVGSCYEKLATVHLQKKGYHIPERNYHCRQEKVDLIHAQDPYLVFVEVEYQADDCMDGPLEAADRRKQGRIRQTATHYTYSHGFAEDCAYRFDVVRVPGERVELVQDIFQIYFARR